VCEGVISLRLSSFGISRNDLQKIVEKAFTTGRMDNNPVDIDEKQVFKILENIL
jgi:alcohol dehydrogenase class IV